MGEQLFPEYPVGVGVVVPYDFAQDREMWRWVPEPTSLHVTRTPYIATAADAGQARLISAPDIVRRAVRDVLLPEPGVVAYSCTSGSFVGGAHGERALREVIRASGAPEAVTTAGSLVAACAALGVDRLALATPYVDDLTDKLENFLAEHGVSTVSRYGLGLLGQIWHVSGEEVAAAVRSADHPDAEAVFVSCTNLPTYDIIAALERELGKPVLTANQVTMWGALAVIGLEAVGPGQALIECRTPGDRPALRIVPDAPVGLPSARSGDDTGDGTLPALYKVRVRLPDESGALARLTAAVAEVGGNILALSVHGQDSRSVIDEMLVGGTMSAERLARVIRRRLRAVGPDGVQVIEADPHELVDAPTRALDLASSARTSGDVLHGLAELLHADAVGPAPGPVPGDEHVLVLDSPQGARLWVRRDWAPFTVTERARAEAFLRAAGPDRPAGGHEVLLPGGEELVATSATGEEIAELDRLLRACLVGAPGDPTPVADWTAADLRTVLVPPGGVCLVVRGVDGFLVAIGSVLAGEDPAAGAEPVLLVHPDYQGQRISRWLRRKLSAAVTAGG